MVRSELRRRTPHHQLPEAKIIPFPARPMLANRLTVRDRQEALHWIHGAAGSMCRLETSAAHEADEIGDFISIYRLGHVWASWGVARCAGSVLLWKADIGRDLGTFPTMQAALENVAFLLNTVMVSPKLEDAALVALKGLRRQIKIADRLLETQILAGRVLAAGLTKCHLSELRLHERTVLAQIHDALTSCPDDAA